MRLKAYIKQLIYHFCSGKFFNFVLMQATKKNLADSSLDEAERYLANAREILKTKAGNGVPGYYTDAKYVKMACNTAWNGVLVALDSKIPLPSRGNRKTVDFYKQYLTTKSRKVLNDFISAYNYLHLFGGYDGDLNRKTAQTGLELAESILDWCRRN
jgi:hypothetical protein